jgi:hypothetical protein
MSTNLIFLFFFQGGLAFAFSYFIMRVMVTGLDQDGRDRMIKGMKKVTLLGILASVVLPLAMFGAYYKSLPEGQSIALAIWPAVWILVIMVALLIGISMGMRAKPPNKQI